MAAVCFIQIEVTEKDCEKIVHCIIPYLNVADMESTCVSALCIVAEHFPDLMWLLMVQLLPNEMPQPPVTAARLQSIQVYLQSHSS